MTARTPIYGLEYIILGEPVRNTRQALENNAKTIEAALLAKAATPPGGSTYAAISAESGWLDHPSPLPANWSTTALGRRYRVIGKFCTIQAELSSSAAWVANVAVATGLPAPSRAWWWPAVAYGGAAMPCYVDAAGALRVANAGAAGGGGFLMTTYPIG